ncbi:MAG: hypothetical protein NXY59_00020 [Aigarchaeota archaeon]|nr:hypothetical protein [Candidatus Pelearchaeum maunauluense]
MSAPGSELLNKVLLNYAARIGVAAKLERVDRSQLEKLITSLDYVGGQEESLLVTSAFAMRQAARNELGRTTAQLVGEALEKCNGKAQARAVLGLAKWVFESIERIPIQIRLEEVATLSFQHYLKAVRERQLA